MTAPNIDPALLARAEATLPDDGLRAVRQAALQGFHGLPGPRDEDWRYTSLAPAADVSAAWLDEVAERGVARAEERTLAPLPDFDAHWLVLRNGLVDEAGFDALQVLAADGIQVRRLADVAGSIDGDSPLEQFNAALLQDGIHISVAPNTTSDKPLAVLFDDTSGVSQARLVIDVADNASLDLIELHRSSGADPQFANTVTQLTLASGASASVLRWQDRARHHQQIGRLRATLSRDATLDAVSFDFGGELVRQDIDANIVGPGATVKLHGLYLADSGQHIDNHTRIDHRVGPATSQEEYRGILNGRTRCVWNGKAIVHPGADGTDAQQANHNLLLSNRAEIDTKPELEIYADDVKCSHGATVGQLDEAALFYMQSRGIARDQASHILTRAFAGRILAAVSNDAVRRQLSRRIDARLDELLEESDT